MKKAIIICLAVTMLMLSAITHSDIISGIIFVCALALAPQFRPKANIPLLIAFLIIAHVVATRPFFGAPGSGNISLVNFLFHMIFILAPSALFTYLIKTFRYIKHNWSNIS